MSSSDRYSRIILASRSPRRRYLLEKAGVRVTVIPSDFEEESETLKDPADYVQALAKGKALAVARRYPADWVIGADTIVVVEDQVLGKPASQDEARAMLIKLNNRTHQVYTGWCIHHLGNGHHFSQAVKTDVQFKSLTPAEIEWYLHTGEPFDKAGGYGIQGLGTFLVNGIRGSFTNVVGLPVCEVVDFLIKKDIIGLAPGTRQHN